VATARFVQTRITADEYDQIREKLGVGNTPPAGGLFHTAAVGADGKIRVFEVWDSRDQAEAWAKRCWRPARSSVSETGHPRSSTSTSTTSFSANRGGATRRE